MKESPSQNTVEWEVLTIKKRDEISLTTFNQRMKNSIVLPNTRSKNIGKISSYQWGSNPHLVDSAAGVFELFR